MGLSTATTKENVDYIEEQHNLFMAKIRSYTDACDLGMVMFCGGYPMHSLPIEAQKYANFMCNKYAMCGEVYLTAYTHYAQAVLNLPCKDDGYKLTPEGQKFFKDLEKSDWQTEFNKEVKYMNINMFS